MLYGNWRNNSLKSDGPADEPLHPHHPFSGNLGSGLQSCNLAAIKSGDRLEASRPNSQLLLLGPGKQWKNLNAIAALLTLFLKLLGYFFIFIITPFDLKWNLATTLDRLLMQLWPSFIFVFFLFARTPEYMKQEFT